MYTEERLFTYLQQFEKDFLQTKTRIIDATEGGAAKRGTIAMTLLAAAQEFCKDPIRDAGSGDHPGLDWSRIGDSTDCLIRRRDEAGEIEQISSATLPLLEEIRDHLDDQSRVNRAISAIDMLRSRMNELGRTYDLVTQFCQPVEFRRFEADRKIAAAKTAASDKQRLQVARDIENVRGIIEASADFQRLMNEVLARLASTPAANPRSQAA
jgi:hypothetical protein